MSSEYVEKRDGGYYLVGIRVSLDSIVCAFNEGQSPETILDNFPALTLARIYGAIAFYLDHRVLIDRYLEDSRQATERNGIPMSEANPALWAKIQHVRTGLRESRG